MVKKWRKRDKMKYFGKLHADQSNQMCYMAQIGYNQKNFVIHGEAGQGGSL
jgi:hypothetical protein